MCSAPASSTSSWVPNACNSCSIARIRCEGRIRRRVPVPAHHAVDVAAERLRLGAGLRPAGRDGRRRQFVVADLEWDRELWRCGAVVDGHDCARADRVDDRDLEALELDRREEQVVDPTAQLAQRVVRVGEIAGMEKPRACRRVRDEVAHVRELVAGEAPRQRRPRRTVAWPVAVRALAALDHLDAPLVEVDRGRSAPARIRFPRESRIHSGQPVGRHEREIFRIRVARHIELRHRRAGRGGEHQLESRIGHQAAQGGLMAVVVIGVCDADDARRAIGRVEVGVDRDAVVGGADLDARATQPGDGEMRRGHGMRSYKPDASSLRARRGRGCALREADGNGSRDGRDGPSGSKTSQLVQVGLQEPLLPARTHARRWIERDGLLASSDLDDRDRRDGEPGRPPACRADQAFPGSWASVRPRGHTSTDFLCYLCPGDPIAVTAVGLRSRPGYGSENMMSALFSGGHVAAPRSAGSSPTHRRRSCVYGPLGVAELDRAAGTLVLHSFDRRAP